MYHLFAPKAYIGGTAPAVLRRAAAPEEAENVEFTTALKLNHVFRRLYAKGDSAVGSFLVLYCRRNGSDQNRLGITTGVKLGHAVDRNRARRRLREAYRLNEYRLKRGYDVVLVARHAAVDGDFAELQRSFLRQCKKVRLLREEAQR